MDGPTQVPDSQTPWQEIAREGTGQLAQGATYERALKYRKVRRAMPRHNH